MTTINRLAELEAASAADLRSEAILALAKAETYPQNSDRRAAHLAESVAYGLLALTGYRRITVGDLSVEGIQIGEATVPIYAPAPTPDDAEEPEAGTAPATDPAPSSASDAPKRTQRNPRKKPTATEETPAS